MTAPRDLTSCPSGKKRYATSAEAEAEIEVAREQRARGVWLDETQEGKVEARAYPHPRCGGWHISSIEKTPEDRQRSGRSRRGRRKR